MNVPLVQSSLSRWRPSAADLQALATNPCEELEARRVLYFPQLAFDLSVEERSLLKPSKSGRAKNVSLQPASGRLKGVADNDIDRERLQQMMQRFADSALALLKALLPAYAPYLQRARTSYRPAEIAGRVSSLSKDDTRLHIDAFPSSPTQGERILRLFCNINLTAPNAGEDHRQAASLKRYLDPS